MKRSTTLIGTRVVRLALVAASLVAGTKALVSTVRAADEVNVSTGNTETGSPLAVRGYDVVAYFVDGKPEVGSAQFTTVHNGATYRFSSQGHLDAFKASPEKYLPQFGGFCAYGCFAGKKFDGDPTLYKIVDGKLYLNLNPQIREKFEEGTAEKIKVAEKNWTKIEHLRPSEIK